jgi:hypothetical protein
LLAGTEENNKNIKHNIYCPCLRLHMNLKEDGVQEEISSFQGRSSVKDELEKILEKTLVT